MKEQVSPFVDFAFKRSFGIEMLKFEKAKTELNDKLDVWLLFLKDPNNRKLEEVMEKETNIKKAITVLDLISQDKQERMLYETRQKAIMDYKFQCL
jgi:hypothetical protein